MWYLKNIQKTLHIYWGGGKLAYLRYLTISTFRHYNPDWQIILYKPLIDQTVKTWTTTELKYAENYTDYLSRVEELGVTIQSVDFSLYGFDNNASEVHKSDFLRWQLLATVGGFWADMDILFFKSMDDLYFNTEQTGDINTVFCISDYGHSIGFLMSSPNNPCFERITQAAKGEYKKEGYQCIGSLLCNKLFPTIESCKIGGIVPHNLDMGVVYAYNCFHVDELYKPYPPQRMPVHAIGIHWYAGNRFSGEYLNRTNGGLIRTNLFIEKYMPPNEPD
jgi:hypothetical protein